MPEATPLSPELSRSVSVLARALVTAARNLTLYPADHPTAKSSVERLHKSLDEAAVGGVLSFGVTPETLLVDGTACGSEGPIGEAAAWLHNRDILQVSFAAEVPLRALNAFLDILSDDIASIRARGGPAKVWAQMGHPAIAIEQIDFASVFEDRDVKHPARRKDDLWRSIVRAVTERRKALDEAAQRRLLEISGDVIAIGELAQDVMAPNFAADGSPMLTSQAAAVVAAYRHLVAIVEVMDPARRTEVMQNLAAATSTLDPRVIMQMLGGPDEGGAVGAGGPTTTALKRGLAAAFDDYKVAQLLATTLALDGQASDRLAGVFDTIAPDEPRKRRVLTMTKSLLSETSFGKNEQFQNLWTSMEELLLTYNERPFVSAQYRSGLDQVGGRAATMAAADLPEELVGLIDTLGQDNVRRLSAILLIDLLTLERDPARAPEVARDVAALCEDLLLAGDYESALSVTRALAEQAATPSAVACAGSRVALDGLSESSAFRETVELLGDMADQEASLVADLSAAIGPAATDVLRENLDVEALTPARARATAIIRRYGADAVGRLAPLVSSRHWYAQVNATALLGAIGSAEAVPLLQPLLRGTQPRVMRAAVAALSNIDDPAAARAVDTILRAATGEQRRAVVEALVAERDPRVVPLLVRILNESEPLGDDHQIVLETLGAMGRLAHDEAVPHIAQVMRRRSWLARKKVRALKQTSLDTLRLIGTPVAEQAISDGAARGDRLLRKLARNMGAQAHG
jgi:HEAT repeat protein